jgi:DNA-binding LacI/PurR family transcriptional regulator
MKKLWVKFSRSAAGLVDSPYNYFGVSLFTCIIQDEYLIGKQAVEILHGIINGIDPVSVDNITVPARLVKGASTCPKKRAASQLAGPN